MRSGIEEWARYDWKRPSEIYGEGNYSLYDKIAPDDIKQGQCGDCYFLSSLSSIAEKPERIQQIFLQDKVNKAGCYAVQLIICGEKKTVVVDDRFPYNSEKQTWAFSRTSSGQEIWVLILEKAWAKVFGSYQRIEAGTTDEALHSLTGCPTKNLIHDQFKKKDQLWKSILFADQQQFPMCCAVASEMEEGVNHSQIKSAGLVDGHAYSLISAREIKSQDGKTVRLCLVRNPWGKKEWTGDWNDSSPLWNDFTKAQVPNFQVANDGCFWISFEDYDSFFYITTICFYRTGYKDAQIIDQVKQGQFSIARLSLSQDAEQTLAISIDQINSRFGETNSNTYEYAPVRFVVSKIIDDLDAQGNKIQSQKFLEGEYEEFTPTVTCAFKQGLKKGDYLLMTQVDFTDAHPLKRFVVSVYCEDKVDLVCLDSDAFGSSRLQQFEEQLMERVQHNEDSVDLF